MSDDPRLDARLWTLLLRGVPELRRFLDGHREVPLIGAARALIHRDVEAFVRETTMRPHSEEVLASDADVVVESVSVSSHAMAPIEVADRLGISPRSVRRARAEGRLVGRRARRGWVFDEDEVQRFAAKRGA